MATDYDTNSSNLNASFANIKKDYGFTYFKPDASQIGVADLNMCYSGRNAPSVTMNDVSIYTKGPQVYHTANSCKLNASLLQSQYIMSDQQNIYKKTLDNGLKKAGLNFIVVDGYYVGEPKYFLNKKSKYTGMATQFDSIINATNQIITDPLYVKYSCEWYGFFCPSATGNWTFKINSNNPSYLWVGDLAINDYENTNATANNTMSNGGQSNLNMNRYYPIRIQYGNRNSSDTFSITISGPHSEEGLPLLYTFFNSDGSLFEKSVIYYSLIENDPDLTAQGLYNCYVTYPDTVTYSQLKNKPSSFVFQTVWNLFNERTENDKLDSFNYLSIDADGIISIFNGSGNVLKSLSDSGGNAIKSTGNLKLGDDGILQIESLSSPGTYITVSVSNTGLDTPQTNSYWESYKAPPNNITNPYKLTSNNSLTYSSNPVILVSNNNKYALQISELGNLIIQQSTDACVSKNSKENNIHYTSASSDTNSRYLYRINGDEKMNNMYMVSNTEKTLLPIDKNTTNIKLIPGQYTPYSGYYPDSSLLKNATVKKQTACQAACDADPNCSYYYSYTNGNGSQNCILNSSSSYGSTLTPNTFIPKQPTSSGDSTLYLRNYGMNLTSSDARYTIPRVDTKDYGSYSEHELLVDKSFILKDSKNIGYNGLDTPLRNELVRNWNYVKGSGEPKNPGPIESFDTQGYQDGKDVRAVGGNPGDDTNLPTEIINKQITPMTAISKDYALLQYEIDGKYREIGKKVNDVTNDQGTGVRDILSSDPQKIYDFSGNTFYYGSKKPLKRDALKDDVNIMLRQTNDMFILGSLTIASLLVAAIYFGRD
jgi:GLEYA domain